MALTLADQNSIFGPTYEGVPSPLVGHTHPYPTRFHGPIWRYPVATRPFVENPMAVTPYAGFGEDPTAPTTWDKIRIVALLVAPPVIGAAVGAAIVKNAVIGAAAGAAIGAVTPWLVSDVKFSKTTGA